jgi:hypothetical protein
MVIGKSSIGNIYNIMGKTRKPLKPKGNRSNILKNTKIINKNNEVLAKLKKELSE